jgi:hypothetical protein
VSESEAHGNETQDGNEHRLSGLQDIISPGARNVAQGLGLYDPNRILTTFNRS